MSSNPARFDSLDHYSMHVLIVEEIVNLFENSVWALRDLVRRIEMVKLRSIPEIGHASNRSDWQSRATRETCDSLLRDARRRGRDIDQYDASA